MSNFSGVNIVLHGPKLSGKTAILHIIGAALRDSGFNVVAKDDIGEISDFRPRTPHSVDDRLISISTSLV